jgi:hypothetical protein
MTETHDAFATHDAYERDGEWYELTTTPFDARAAPASDGYRVQVIVPTLDGATEEPVEDVLEDGWFETFRLRLDDADGATRADVSVPEPTVERDDGLAVVEFAFDHEEPRVAVETAKVLAEYVEGTYVEGIVPGFSYLPPVAGLLARARTQGDSEGEGDRGPMPL